jgi:hypothetical protein
MHICIALTLNSSTDFSDGTCLELGEASLRNECMVSSGRTLKNNVKGISSTVSLGIVEVIVCLRSIFRQSSATRA